MEKNQPTTVTEYISQAAPAVQSKLEELRACLKAASPNAKELLKWGKPAFEAEYILYVYAGFKNHTSLHPTPEAITAFADELNDFTTSDNTVQFPVDQPLPLDLIRRMAEFRVEQSKAGVTWK